ncbi:hypothetical protein RUM43_014315 [Polyplax serrata]|uniref:Lipocalin/cytosolic fatty-acid binding domain-containing protein n=1 Tax=Polyplax serrata TaxID=468196 RepID=A0AAN8S656_POLSC
MKGIVIVIAAVATCALAQVPGFGWCPDYSPMADFDLNRYTGVWYEAERYFTVLEAGSRCVRSNYTKGLDGKFRVSNEITNRLTGIRRVVDGVVQNIGKGGEGKISVKYSTLPVPVDTQYSVLDTDYDNYSVVWSCSSLGPINTQSAWVMTRQRLAPGTVLQTAYGVLDKYKISRTFFVKTDQSDCIFTDPSAIPVEDNENEKKKAEATNKIDPQPQRVPTKVETFVKEPISVAQQQFQPVLVETLNGVPTQVPVVAHHVQNGPKIETVYLKPFKEVPETFASIEKKPAVPVN